MVPSNPPENGVILEIVEGRDLDTTLVTVDRTLPVPRLPTYGWKFVLTLNF